MFAIIQWCHINFHISTYTAQQDTDKIYLTICKSVKAKKRLTQGSLVEWIGRLSLPLNGDFLKGTSTSTKR